MNYLEGSKRIAELRERIAETRSEMRALQGKIDPQEVNDYSFATPQGEIRLSQLFGGKQDLFVIHNMGSGCPYCTLWADGFNGIFEHVRDRAAFVVSSPDTPEVQQRFAQGRGWKFPMVSHRNTSFAADMGYRSETGGWVPGVSVFQRRDGRIVRVADSGFSPGDDFCALWHFLELLPQGSADWQPRLSYRES